MARKPNKQFWRRVQYFVAAWLVSSGLVVTLASGNQVSAATDFIDPNANGSTNSWSVTGSASHFGAVDEGTRQPTTPNTSDYVSNGANDGSNLFLRTETLPNVIFASQIQVWLHHISGDSRYNCQLGLALYDDNESTQRATAQSLPLRSSNTWDSVTFSGLSLSQSQLDSLSLRFGTTKNGSGGPEDCKIYAVYADITYSQAVLSADVVDSGGNPVASPSASLSSLNSDFSCQTSTGTLGTSSQKVRVTNTTTNGNWTLSIAATDGASALWSNGTDTYDFNDPSGGPAGCANGQLTVDTADNGSITAQGGCSSAGISKGAAAFSQSMTDNVTLLSASGSQTGCYFDLEGVDLSQKIPPETPSSITPYSLNMTLTVTAS